jgi:outer membrane protein OmpA-like peptidoglycan-associated protein
MKTARVLCLTLACGLAMGAWAADEPVPAPVLREGQVSEAVLVDALAPPLTRGGWAPGQRPRPAKASLLITFVTGSALLTAPAEVMLAQLAAAMKNQRLAKASFTIEGHADPRGSAARNQQLSQARAQSVADYLVQTHGLDAARLKPEGKGSSEPLKPDVPAAPENRRVTIVARPA